MAKGSSKAVQAKYALYAKDQVWLKNKKRKQAKHLKNHPNDLQSKTLNTSYGRKNPNKTVWSSVTKELAQLFKQVYGKCSQDIFNTNNIIANVALTNISQGVKRLPKQTGNFFSLAARLK